MSGKSTQAQLLASLNPEPSYIMSGGEWLRSIDRDTDLGQFILNNWNHDHLGPLVTEHLDKTIGKITEFDHTNLLVIVDGFPRNVPEAEQIASIARGHPVQVVELQLNTSFYPRPNRAQEDASAEIAKIRHDSYTRKMPGIKQVLHERKIPFVTIESQPNRQEETTRQLLDLKGKRITIPPTPPRVSIANKRFIEVGEIDRACIFQMALRLAQSTRLHQSFFGTHPISLTRNDLTRLRRFPYLVSLKAEGVRYICLVHNNRLWLISRKMRVFVSKADLPSLEKFEGSLLDGELIDEQYFLVLDCIAMCGESCKNEPILERMRRSVNLGILLYTGSIGIYFRPQEYLDRTQIQSLLERQRSLQWKSDGVILQPARLPYRLGIDFNLFKWKPPEKNTVDFFFNEADSGLYCKKVKDERVSNVKNDNPIDTSKAPVLFFDNETMVRMGVLSPQFKPDWLRSGMVIECFAAPSTPSDLCWIPQAHRGDKLWPNVEWVAQSVIQSIIDSVTLEDLVEQCLQATIRAEEMDTRAESRILKKRHRDRD